MAILISYAFSLDIDIEILNNQISWSYIVMEVIFTHLLVNF